MPKMDLKQPSFAAGQLSADVRMRTDLPFYQQGAKELTNVQVTVQGGVVSTPGTELMDTLPTTSGYTVASIFAMYVAGQINKAWVVTAPGAPHIRSVFYNTYATWTSTSSSDYFQGGTFKANGTNFASAAKDEWIYSAYNYIDRLSIRAQVKGFPGAEVPVVERYNLSVLPTEESGYKIYSSVSAFTSTTLTIGNPFFIASDVGRLLTINDGLYQVATFVSTTQITMTQLRAQTASPIVGTGAHLFLWDTPITSVTPASAGTVGESINLTATSNTWRSAASYPDANDVGSYVEINGGLLEITSVTSATVAVGKVVKALSSATKAWPGAWKLRVPLMASNGLTSPRTWWDASPMSAMAFHEGRMVLATSKNGQCRLIFSKSGEIGDFATGTNDNDAFVRDLDGAYGRVIGMVSSNGLVVITTTGEYMVTGDSSGPLTPTTARARKISAFGGYGKPINVGKDAAFITSDRKSIMMIATSADYSDPEIIDVTARIRSDIGTIYKIVATGGKNPTLWAVIDTDLWSMTLDKAGGVFAWSRQVMGTEVHDIAALEDELGILRKKSIAGTTYWVIEVMRPSNLPNLRLYQLCSYSGGKYVQGYLKSMDVVGVGVTSTAVTGGTVESLTDDYFTGTTDSSGYIYTTNIGPAYIGLEVDNAIQLLPPDTMLQDGDMGHRQVTQHKAVANVVDTRFLAIEGQETGDGTAYTGAREVGVSGWIPAGEEGPTVTITNSTPYRFNLISVKREVSVN